MTVELLNGGHRFMPSFRDLYRIIRGIIRCEELNYPDLRWPAVNLVRKFLAASCSPMPWEAIRELVRIPDREADGRPDIEIGETVAEY